MPQDIPSKPEDLGQLSTDRVRQFMFDQTLQQNLLEMDLTFSEPQILSAMDFAALDYNEMDPKVHTVSPRSLPFALCFLYGVAFYLTQGKIMEWTRNDINYTAGNMTASPEQARIKHYKELMMMFMTEWKTRAKLHKLAINIACVAGPL